MRKRIASLLLVAALCITSISPIYVKAGNINSTAESDLSESYRYFANAIYEQGSLYGETTDWLFFPDEQNDYKFSAINKNNGQLIQLTNFEAANVTIIDDSLYFTDAVSTLVTDIPSMTDMTDQSLGGYLYRIDNISNLSTSSEITRIGEEGFAYYCLKAGKGGLYAIIASIEGSGLDRTYVLLDKDGKTKGSFGLANENEMLIKALEVEGHVYFEVFGVERDTNKSYSYILSMDRDNGSNARKKITGQGLHIACNNIIFQNTENAYLYSIDPKSARASIISKYPVKQFQVEYDRIEAVAYDNRNMTITMENIQYPYSYGCENQINGWTNTIELDASESAPVNNQSANAQAGNVQSDKTAAASQSGADKTNNISASSATNKPAAAEDDGVSLQQAVINEVQGFYDYVRSNGTVNSVHFEKYLGSLNLLEFVSSCMKKTGYFMPNVKGYKFNDSHKTEFFDALAKKFIKLSEGIKTVCTYEGKVGDKYKVKVKQSGLLQLEQLVDDETMRKELGTQSWFTKAGVTPKDYAEDKAMVLIKYLILRFIPGFYLGEGSQEYTVYVEEDPQYKYRVSSVGFDEPGVFMIFNQYEDDEPSSTTTEPSTTPVEPSTTEASVVSPSSAVVVPEAPTSQELIKTDFLFDKTVLTLGRQAGFEYEDNPNAQYKYIYRKLFRIYCGKEIGKNILDASLSANLTLLGQQGREKLLKEIAESKPKLEEDNYYLERLLQDRSDGKKFMEAKRQLDSNNERLLGYKQIENEIYRIEHPLLGAVKDTLMDWVGSVVGVFSPETAANMNYERETFNIHARGLASLAATNDFEGNIIESFSEADIKNYKSFINKEAGIVRSFFAVK